MSHLHRVLYCSRNTIRGAPSEIANHIEQILAVSRRNNARDGVTGGLIYSAGCFAQVLEGPIEALETAFERIQCDPRHSEVTVVASSAIDAPAFADWSMAFHGFSEQGDALAEAALQGAFAGRTSAGDTLMGLLQTIVTNEQSAFASKAAA